MSLAFPSTEEKVPAPMREAGQALIDVRIESIRFGTHDTNLYELRALHGALPPSRPGAHVGVHLPGPIVRHYSLVQPDEAPHSYLIGVKRDAASRGGSSFMHEKLRVGDKLVIEAPRNNFPLHEDAPSSLLIAGGIGVTPVFCMWRRLRQLGRPVRLVYSCRSRRDALFLGDLEGQAGVLLHFDDEHAGAHLDIATLLAGTPADAHVYCCGPIPMLKSFDQLTAAWPAGQVHVEYFTPAQEQALDGGFIVKLGRSGKSVPVPAGQSVLDALRACGIDTAFSCEEGICGACETRVLGGIPDHRDSVLTEQERLACDRMMICCSGSKTPELVLDL